jgi:hypothetical protein
VLVVSWLLKREYRQHRVLDAELPPTYSKWLASLDKRLQQEASEMNRRIIKVVIHPAEIETWARREDRQMNERARSNYAVLMWRMADDIATPCAQVQQSGIEFEQHRRGGSAQIACPRCDQIEHGLRVVGRGGHRLQHVDCRGLLFNSLTVFGVALSQRRGLFLQCAIRLGAADGDHCLLSKGHGEPQQPGGEKPAEGTGPAHFWACALDICTPTPDLFVNR